MSPLLISIERLRVIIYQFSSQFSFISWHFFIKNAQYLKVLLITIPIFSSEFFESQNSQTRIKSDQKSAFDETFVAQNIVIMNTKEATAYFCIS